MRRKVELKNLDFGSLQAFQARKSLGEHVFDSLKQAIIRGNMSPGEWLVESHIADTLGISRTPVREAIHKLEREGLIENIAEADDSLLEKYLEGETLTEDELKAALKKGTLDQTFVPVLCGSATRNIGVDQLCDFTVNCLPNPAERGGFPGTDTARTVGRSGLRSARFPIATSWTRLPSMSRGSTPSPCTSATTPRTGERPGC